MGEDGMSNIFLTGGSGRLGRELVGLFPNTTAAPTHDEMDLTDYVQVNRYLHNWRRTWKKPNDEAIIIHLAAMISPPACEANKEKAYAVNVQGTMNLLDACHEQLNSVYLILISSPCVFSGFDETPKTEGYIQYPDNYYGISKMLQEMVVRRFNDELYKFLIIRGNFVPYVKWPYPVAFTDRKSNYLFAHQLARAIKEVVDIGLQGEVHLLGDKILSMYELAHKCPNSEDVKPITYEEYYKQNPGAVKLTKNMVMETSYHKKFSIDDPK
jgi:dTDP-4-dehydrorhamnose reductase